MDSFNINGKEIRLKGFKLNDETHLFIDLRWAKNERIYPPLTGGIIATSAFCFRTVIASLSFST
jgi:hypothetical protein